jgi:preprotein translocase subunit SecG
MQKGRDSGLGALAGSSDTYWDKNKSHSLEGRMMLITRVLTVSFFILALALNVSSI